ncbi:hypothetical protein B0T25DRAFT_292367 [Lasiosphaeria hispida]|uniref:Uncharacterized protein n=1 Tax=Lasiosphaeria hispida TaxID=260671 RepID=A0AAJ0HCB8_9PEZI|nr:hypothetical protein B0T25DRAFT_292367 [Lasiosphaeria hispida]
MAKLRPATGVQFINAPSGELDRAEHTFAPHSALKIERWKDPNCSLLGCPQFAPVPTAAVSAFACHPVSFLAFFVLVCMKAAPKNVVCLEGCPGSRTLSPLIAGSLYQMAIRLVGNARRPDALGNPCQLARCPICYSAKEVRSAAKRGPLPSTRFSLRTKKKKGKNRGIKKNGAAPPLNFLVCPVPGLPPAAHRASLAHRQGGLLNARRHHHLWRLRFWMADCGGDKEGGGRRSARTGQAI